MSTTMSSSLEQEITKVLGSSIVYRSMEFCRQEMAGVFLFSLTIVVLTDQLGNDPSHDYAHVERVLRNALHIARTEPVEGILIYFTQMNSWNV